MFDYLTMTPKRRPISQKSLSSDPTLYQSFQISLNHLFTPQDFSFIRKIGRGGFGEVYEAKCISTGEVVALKVLDKRKLKKEEYRKVCNEIEIHKNIQHPSIVKVKQIKS